MKLRPFQQRFIRDATAPGVDTAALCLPRGNGKSWLGGHLVTRALTPGDPLFVAGSESVLCAASIEQARIVHRFARSVLEPAGGYRFLDSATRAGIVHLETNTRLRVVGSNGRTAMGLVNCPLAICDEPGAWEVNGGQLLHDAIQTAQGKPNSPLRSVYIGTLAPGGTEGHWWHALATGGADGSTVAHLLQGDPARWSDMREIVRVNPLARVDARFKKKLTEERDAARRDSRLKARFLSYRLNVPSPDESAVLLTVGDWERVIARPVPPRQGRPIIAYDLGHGRSWSAAVAIYENGRTEAIAVAPGLPGIDAQEVRDRVPAGTYHRLVDTGVLLVATGLRVQPVEQLHAAAMRAFGPPAGAILCDRARINEVRDVVGGGRLQERVTRWFGAAEDIRACRKMAADGPLSVAEPSRLLMAASLSAAMVKNDDAGSVRLVKRDASNNSARDDVAAALVLAAGEFRRRGGRPRTFPKPRIRSLAAA